MIATGLIGEELQGQGYIEVVPSIAVRQIELRCVCGSLHPTRSHESIMIDTAGSRVDINVACEASASSDPQSHGLGCLRECSVLSIRLIRVDEVSSNSGDNR